MLFLPDDQTECYEDAITLTDLSSRWGPDTFALTGNLISMSIVTGPRSACHSA